MKKIIEQLRPFIQMKAYDKKSDYDDRTFEIFDGETNEEIGIYTIDDKNRLEGFTLLDEHKSGNLTKEQILAIANSFIQTFYPDKMNEYELSAILDLDDPYMVIYEKRDKKHGIFLPSTGFSISISTGGQVTNFIYYNEDYYIRYDDELISEEDALKKYMDGLDFELVIKRLDKETFKNGDGQYHLVYEVNEHAMDIPIDGSEPVSIREEFHFDSPLERQKTPKKTIYELIGIGAEYKQIDRKLEDGVRKEIWTKEKLTDSPSFDMDEIDPGVIKLAFDNETGILIQATSGENQSVNDQEFTFKEAKKRAIDLMFKLFPNANEQFLLELAEDETEDETLVDEDLPLEPDGSEEENDWDDDFSEEPSYTFYFHLFHNGVRVDQHVSYVDVGKYSGKIKYFHLDVPLTHPYKHLSTEPAISMEEAKKIYIKNTKMEKMFVHEYDENEKAFYSLSYVPSFPKTIGHVRAIDALTGEALYVDIGDALMFN